MGIAVTDEFDLIFDTLESTRKARNLAAEPRVAFVIGGPADGEQQTVQYEGLADRPLGADLERVRAYYLATFPDGDARLAWPGLVHLRVRPVWLRYSDYRVEPPVILEFDAAQLAALR